MKKSEKNDDFIDIGMPGGNKNLKAVKKHQEGMRRLNSNQEPLLGEEKPKKKGFFKRIFSRKKK